MFFVSGGTGTDDEAELLTGELWRLIDDDTIAEIVYDLIG